MQVIRAVKEVRSFSYVRPAECIIDQQRGQKEEEGEGRFICQKVGGGPKEEEEGPGDMPASSPTDRRLGGGSSSQDGPALRPRAAEETPNAGTIFDRLTISPWLADPRSQRMRQCRSA